ncbi:MAG TPA: hypothetical protein VGR62_14675 [Candidatus Binatia bacterium]|jgi:hypothetical protein|nr:hypothetical protein [Candidatus Binatia bacterium]
MILRHAAHVVLVGWVLIVPPWRYRDGGTRMDDKEPLWKWRRLATYESQDACRRDRMARIVAAVGDEAWAEASLSRCFSAERADGGSLTPDEMEP